MVQGQVQINKQQQEQKLTNSVSQLQLLQAKLSELPLTQLVDYIRTEMDDNPALEMMLPDDHVDNHEDSYDNNDIDNDMRQAPPPACACFRSWQAQACRTSAPR